MEVRGNGPYKLEYKMDYCSSKRLCGLILTFSQIVLGVEVFWKSLSNEHFAICAFRHVLFSLDNVTK